MPAVYDFWTGRDGQGYIVMEYKDGQVLQRKWHTTSPTLRRCLYCSDLEFYVKELRALPQPSPWGRIGSVYGTTFFDFNISRSEMCGPFQDERNFNNWGISELSHFSATNPPTVERLNDLRAKMPDHHRIHIYTWRYCET